MCGRARLSSDVSEIRRTFAIPPQRPAPNFAANWNAAPTQDLPIVRYFAEDEARGLELRRWGLVPFWAKDLKIGYATFNAKAESLSAKPAFREAFRRRRCLVPFDSFYEWKKRGRDKQPYAIAHAHGSLLAMAGLFENWRSPQGDSVKSFTIVTTAANALVSLLHDRMPAILDKEAWQAWLGEEPAKPEELRSLLVPYPAERLRMWPVSKRVGNVKNNDPSLVAEAALAV
jgi:putative SOS response-associated peptidase YedK